jgi:hypothetical protein
LKLCGDQAPWWSSWRAATNAMSIDDATLAARLSAAVDPKVGVFSLAF